ncbi:MAG: glycosyltransferase [Anaerolineae bacterium]|nr:glycosyltransferase [Anaerolineae bacterium]
MEQTQPILLIDLAKAFGGAEVRVLDTAKSLHGRYPYAVATLAGSPLHQRLEADRLISLAVPFGRGDGRLLVFLARAIRQAGYRVVDAHNVQSQFWGHLAALVAGAPKKISTVHSAYKLEHAGSLKGRLYEQVLRLNAHWGAQFVAVSEAVQSYLQGLGIHAERIALIHNSLSLAPFPAAREEHPLMQALGWGKEVYVVIVVARLEPVKGHTFLLEALRQLAPVRPHLRCLIVGDGRTRADLEAQARQAQLQGRVHFAGFRDDIPALLSASDAFCLPSLSEGLPFALLEACAQRLPLLVTQVGGMAQLLTHGHTAFLVPSANPAALGRGLGWLMDHPEEARSMGQIAFAYLQQRLSPAEMLSRTLAVYS